MITADVQLASVTTDNRVVDIWPKLAANTRDNADVIMSQHIPQPVRSAAVIPTGTGPDAPFVLQHAGVVNEL